MDSTTRPTLLESLRDGTEPRAWEGFFERYWPLIYGCTKHGGCSDHAAEDIVQDVLVTVFNGPDRFRHTGGVLFVSKSRSVPPRVHPAVPHEYLQSCVTAARTVE